MPFSFGVVNHSNGTMPDRSFIFSLNIFCIKKQVTVAGIFSMQLVFYTAFPCRGQFHFFHECTPFLTCYHLALVATKTYQVYLVDPILFPGQLTYIYHSSPPHICSPGIANVGIMFPNNCFRSFSMKGQ